MLVRMRNNNVPSSGDPCKFMHDLYIAEIYTPEAIFLSVTMWVDWHSILHSKLWKKVAFGKLAHYGSSRSFKVIKTGTIRQPVCDFLWPIVT